MNRRVVIAELAELQAACSAEFQGQAAGTIARRGTFIVALTGGSVAPAFFPALATLPVDWSRIEIFWIDERAVPPDHPDSNYALASKLLLTPARVPAARIHRMCGELPDLDQAARRASDELRSIAGDPPRLDLALLGVGADGHIASIFPGRSSARADPVIPVYDSPKPPARRLTLAFPVLAGAGIVIVIALGAAKAAVMRAALDGSGDTPVAELLRRTASSLVLLDRAAGLS
jgi:6-phosphogluconolactonase